MTPTEKKARDIYERLDKNKEHSLICVDELIIEFSQYATDSHFYFWQEVKQHIEKL